MSRYRVEYTRSAEKQLKAIKDARVGRPIRSAIEALADNPRPPGCLKLVGTVNQWRVRVGDWRVVYVIEDGRLVVLVVRVAPRGAVYE